MRADLEGYLFIPFFAENLAVYSDFNTIYIGSSHKLPYQFIHNYCIQCNLNIRTGIPYQWNNHKAPLPVPAPVPLQRAQQDPL